MPQRRNLRQNPDDPAVLAAGLPAELRSFEGWHYPSGFHDYMAALSQFLVEGQPLTPVMNAAGLSAAEWYRRVLSKEVHEGPERFAPKPCLRILQIERP